MTMRGAANQITICEVLREINDLHQENSEHDNIIRQKLFVAETMAKKMSNKLLQYNKRVFAGWWKRNKNYEKTLRKRLNKRYIINGRAEQKFTKYEKRGAYHWKEYETNKEYRLHVDTIIKFFLSHPPQTLLDVGCGDCLIASKLADCQIDVTGIDNNKTAIDLAIKVAPNVRTRVATISDLSGEKYDAVLISNVIEHVDNDLKMLEQALSLSNNGVLVTTVEKNKKRGLGAYHVREYSESGFITMMKTVFKNVMYFKVGNIMYGWGVGRV